ncbi:MAG: electron transfer flavoprotein subunit alpha/FixB family protein [Anaerolineales bacterium]|jgi:electron transfer flavoprotein alpha subunit
MMGQDKSPVWVIAEQIGGKIHTLSFELIGQARKIADDLQVSVEVVLLGHGLSGQVEKLFFCGADVVYLGDSVEFEQYQPEIFSARIVALSKDVKPQIMLVGSTYVGRELAPLIAAKLVTGLSAHCIDLVLNDERVLEQQIPAYGGILSIICPQKKPQIATIAQGVFPQPVLDEGRSGKLVPVEPPRGMNIRVKTLEVVIEEPEGVPLDSASIVVAGGAGAGCLEGWKEIELLAGVLNAALGSTRPAVDEGWTELDTMIGQSGKMVHPDFYIGVGLSGEQQHMVGIKGAKVMVAVNNDPKAPVFQQVDYGIVEDCRQFLPVLVNKIRRFQTR